MRRGSTGWSPATQFAAMGVPSGRLRGNGRRPGGSTACTRGVYAVGHPPLTPHARWLAAVLACSEGTVLSHRSCAALRGFRRDWAGGVDVTVAGSEWAGRAMASRCIARTSYCQLRSPTSPAFPCTTAARTVVDLAAVVRPDAGRVRDPHRSVEAARHPRTRSPPSLPICRGVAGPGSCGRSSASPTSPRTTRAVATSADSGGSSSEPGCRRRKAITGSRSRHHPAGGVEVDFAWPDRRIAVEIDSALYHETERARINDPARDRA